MIGKGNDGDSWSQQRHRRRRRRRVGLKPSQNVGCSCIFGCLVRWGSWIRCCGSQFDPWWWWRVHGGSVLLGGAWQPWRGWRKTLRMIVVTATWVWRCMGGWRVASLKVRRCGTTAVEEKGWWRWRKGWQRLRQLLSGLGGCWWRLHDGGDIRESGWLKVLSVYGSLMMECGWNKGEKALLWLRRRLAWCVGSGSMVVQWFGGSGGFEARVSLR